MEVQILEENLKKVVTVDDNASYLAVVRNQLKSVFEVYPAPSAIKLFTIMGNFIPDLVLLDIDMPGMDGYDVIKSMKANPRYKDIPVVFLTAQEDELNAEECLNLGAADFITKPISGALLVRRVSNILQLEDQKKELLESRAIIKDLRDQQKT